MNIEEIKADINKPYLIYTKKSVCELCKGLCCKTAAGIYDPDDFSFEITTPFIIHLLCTKMFTVESVGDGDDLNYVLRPRHIDEDPINPEVFGGVCVNWDADKGCTLKEFERPYQCRALIPLADNYTCQHKASDKAKKTDMIERWIPYQTQLKNAVANFKIVAKGVNYKFDENGRCVDIYENIQEKMDLIKKVIGKTE